MFDFLPKIPHRFDLLGGEAISYISICVQGRGEEEVGAGKGLMDKSSTAATATAHLDAIRKREKKKQAHVRILVKNSPWILFAVGTCVTCFSPRF